MKQVISYCTPAYNLKLHITNLLGWTCQYCGQRNQTNSCKSIVKAILFLVSIKPTIFLLFFSLSVLVWLLFEGGIYFVWKPADSNDKWNKYTWAIQLALIDAGSNIHSFSVLLSAMVTSRTALEVAQWTSAAIFSTPVHAPCILVAASIQRWHLFHSYLLIVQLLFKGPNYSRAASNRRNTVSNL